MRIPKSEIGTPESEIGEDPGMRTRRPSDDEARAWAR